MIFLAETYSVLYFKLYGIILLAKVCLNDGEFQDAISLTDAIMPKVLETEDTKLIGLAYKTIGEIYLNIHTLSDNGNGSHEVENKELLDKSLEYLAKSLQCMFIFIFIFLSLFLF